MEVYYKLEYEHALAYTDIERAVNFRSLAYVVNANC